MKEHIDSITAAFAADATSAARLAGSAACRHLLAVLEPAASEAVAPAQAMPQLIAMLSKMDVNQLLDVAIERLRALNAAGPSPKPEDRPRSMSIRMVPVPAALTGKR